MKLIASLGIASTLLVIALATPAAAHPSATVIESPSGERCYIFTNDTEVPEFWRETNGIITGGVPANSPAAHITGEDAGGSGLQRDSDTMYEDVSAWLVDCGLGA